MIRRLLFALFLTACVIALSVIPPSHIEPGHTPTTTEVRK